ncbi:sensor histidine kinase [Paenibacillus massiliensis]|uniref:sensor histidine kinase n=1 Tax=Paenibacillus massiliensis TaxID=225917 RepID=UPI000422AD98|nr:histidine kinase [Paenibacillus massiliensis]
MVKINFYTKFVTILVIMLIPVMVLYFYSNKTTTDVLSEELDKSNLAQLAFFQSQVNTQIELVSSWPNLLMHDPDISSFQDIYLEDDYLNLDTINLVKRIQTKLSIQENSSNWKASLNIYSPSLNRVVSERDAREPDREELEAVIHPGWKIEPYEENGEVKYTFSFYSSTPYAVQIRPDEVQMVIKVEFDSSNIQGMLDGFKNDGGQEPFYYKQGMGVILNRTADQELTNRLIQELSHEELRDMENRTVQVDGNTYRVNIVLSKLTGWYLIDYSPLSDILEPIHKSNQLFYGSVGGLLLLSFLAAYMLYSQVQVPIRQLVRGFHRLMQEDYSVRMKVKGQNEFSFVALRFNMMVEQIQQLFEKVYVEKIHVREARLKQLQSQINPHFFYNCFSFITSMAKLKNHEAVIAMSHHLSRYYRYTTRQERDMVSLQEEIAFTAHYLEIQTMRMKRLQYKIELPRDMEKLQVPPLLIQPFVENAVIHGIEPSSAEGLIELSAEHREQDILIHIDDNGTGLSEEALHNLASRLVQPMDEHMGCGVWNVYQRMRLRFGSSSTLSFSHSPLGGLRVTIHWSLNDSDSDSDSEQGRHTIL